VGTSGAVDIQGIVEVVAYVHVCVLMLADLLPLMLLLLLLHLLLLLLLQVAGSARGVSAFQMDIKVEGITLDIMRQVGNQSSLSLAEVCSTNYITHI
jgi:hypothetical protein